MNPPELYIVDCGHGNAAILKSDDDVLVVDTGAKTALLEALDSLEICRIQTVIVSHADSDHISGLLSLLENDSIEVGSVRINADQLKESNIWLDVVFELDARNIAKRTSIESATSPCRFTVGSVEVEIVAPASALVLAGRSSGSTRLSSNSLSAVVRLDVAGKPMALLPGDLDRAGLTNAKQRKANLRAPVVVFPHHGGLPGKTRRNTFATEFHCAVRPDIVIFSIGRGKYATPDKGIVAAIRTANPNVRICCTQLSEHCAKTLPNSATHLLPVFSSGQSAFRCCAGTVKVILSDPPQIYPDVAKHEAFVISSAPHALCR